MTHSFPTRRYSDRHSFDLLRKERGLTEEDTPEQLGLRSEQHRESLDLAQRDLRILETVRLNAELEQAKREESRANERLAAAQERTRSEEHTSELPSLMRTSYAVFCLKQKIH